MKFNIVEKFRQVQLKIYNIINKICCAAITCFNLQCLISDSFLLRALVQPELNVRNQCNGSLVEADGLKQLPILLVVHPAEEQLLGYLLNGLR